MPMQQCQSIASITSNHRGWGLGRSSRPLDKGAAPPTPPLDPPLDLWLSDRIFLFAQRQSSTGWESFFVSLCRLRRLSYSLVFCTCSSVRWISWAVPFACWEEKPLAKPSLRMTFSATPWLALWLASWQLFLFRARPLQLPSWSRWWLPRVSRFGFAKILFQVFGRYLLELTVIDITFRLVEWSPQEKITDSHFWIF